MDDILEGLTAAQTEAVTHKNGPMLVLAGAGSGKTRVVTRRIAYLLSHGVWPSQILAMTFTNKAAREMQERIAQLINGEAPRNIGTFHGCCARFLRHDIELLNDGRNRNFTIYDDGEQLTVIKRVLKNMGQPHPSGLAPSGVQDLINNAKAQRIDAEVGTHKQGLRIAVGNTTHARGARETRNVVLELGAERGGGDCLVSREASGPGAFGRRHARDERLHGLPDASRGRQGDADTFSDGA